MIKCYKILTHMHIFLQGKLEKLQIEILNMMSTFENTSFVQEVHYAVYEHIFIQVLKIHIEYVSDAKIHNFTNEIFSSSSTVQ